MFNATAGTPSRGVSLRPSKRNALIMGALAGSTLALTIGLYVWQTSEIAQIEKEVASKMDNVHNGERTAKQLEQVRQEASAIDGKLRYLEQNVSQGAYLPTMLQQMEKQATRFGLVANNSNQKIEIPPAPPPLTREEQKEGKKLPPPPPYNKARIDMDLTGTYQNVARFIHSLTRFEKIIAVNSVMEQSREENPTVSPKLTIKITMTGYVFPETETLVPGAKPKTTTGSLSERRAMENQILSTPASQPK